MVIYDGQKYESEADIPDFGSIELVGIDGGKENIVQKRGFSNYQLMTIFQREAHVCLLTQEITRNTKQRIKHGILSRKGV